LEKEGYFVYYAVLSALGETDIGEQIRASGAPLGGFPPPGIKASNPEKTLTLITGDITLEFEYSGYKPSFLAILFPLLNGKITLTYKPSPIEGFVFVIDGSLQIGNVPLISSMQFVSCMIDEALLEKTSGRVIINGERFSFRELIGAAYEVY
jgi:hypothetical protein